jgi:hypothetical protein
VRLELHRPRPGDPRQHFSVTPPRGRVTWGCRGTNMLPTAALDSYFPCLRSSSTTASGTPSRSCSRGSGALKLPSLQRGELAGGFRVARCGGTASHSLGPLISLEGAGAEHPRGVCSS